MKRNLFFVIAIFIATSMSAQFYAGIGAGYGLGADKAVLGVETTDNSALNNYGSYGNGANFTLKLGFMFSENLGVELGSSYLIGSTQTIAKSDGYLKEAKSSGLRLAPQIVAKLDNGLYTRIGVIIPAMGKTVGTEVNDNGAGPGVKTEATKETKGSFSTGFIGAIGYAYALSDNMDLFAEIEYIGLSINAGTAEITQYDVAGTSQLDALPTQSKEIEYVDEVMDTDNTNADDSLKALRTKAPFSSVGINVGIVMKF